MRRLLDWLWFHSPVLTTRRRLERRNWTAGKNGFELGRDYERLHREAAQQ